MPTLLALESSCDETAAAVMVDGQLRANIIAAQLDHAPYGGVIPELASRLHQQQIVRVVEAALREAKVDKSALDAVAFTQGPGLLGALLVGTSFAKAYAFALGIPLVAVNHMQAHVLANFLQPNPPEFPFICLTVSGGHTQLVLVRDYLNMVVLGETIDDAAGEAFDKGAKLMGLPYPGGPEIDKLAARGDAGFHDFPTPRTAEPLQFSFSGLKTALRYLLRDGLAADPDYVDKHEADIAAAYQHRIISILLDKLALAAREQGVQHLAIAGGVSANRELRQRFQALCDENGWQAHIPPFAYCTDNAAMIAMAGHLRFLAGDHAGLDVAPYTRGFERA
ncbi:MAG: tRNA (adenosine(37)-N6)-threonylcarbamoyltransferase complex transferase subunit TsaD [Bacteroidetes bacterium]|nr:MAG: tRNA (adenosine(37)-N6)-threonylcarbamoyltransferase complex transferase subunit TsaD [Bacteroidota bacterium]